jgi:hypothetical protein
MLLKWKRFNEPGKSHTSKKNSNFRRNSMTYATPSPANEEIYTWLYAPGPYSTTNPYPNK